MTPQQNRHLLEKQFLVSNKIVYTFTYESSNQFKWYSFPQSFSVDSRLETKAQEQAAFCERNRFTSNIALRTASIS